MAGILKVDRVQSDSNLAFQVGSSNVAYFNSTGLNITGGEIITNGSTLRTSNGLIYANNGIAFPASAISSSDPNTLDEYEEGTWTPQVYVGSTAATMGSSSLNFGTYVKIGRMVYVTARVVTSNFNGGSGTFYIYGLPFTCTTYSRSGGAFQFFDFSIPSGFTQVNPSIAADTTYVRYDMFRGSGSSDLMTGAQVQNGYGSGFGLTYISST